MPLPQLNLHRHDRITRAPITPSGEIDLATAPHVHVHAALGASPSDGIRTGGAP